MTYRKFKKKKPLHEFFSINDVEYLVMESKEDRKVGLYIHTGNLLSSIIHIATFKSLEAAKSFLENVNKGKGLPK